MTIDEMSLIFDIQYNNLNSNQAGKIEPYEKSVFLTKAQHMIEEQLYSQVDQVENVRKKIANLISSISLKSTQGIKTGHNTIFKLPKNLRAILHESLVFNANQGCLSNATVDVRPITYDTLDRMLSNPYIFTDTRALRLDTSIDNEKASEIIVKTDGNYVYNVDYLRIASPLFVKGCLRGDMIDEVSYDPSIQYECELESTTHQAIVDLAVQMSIQVYKS